MILKVARLGHPILREVAREVTPDELASPGVQSFLDDLLETMFEYDGAGLAAPQVHVPLRVVVLTLDSDPEFLVNPRIEVLTDTVRRTWEGCLSVPEMRGLVERPDHIRLHYLDRDGNERTCELQGFTAVVVQHECDHLDGVLYVDRVLPRSLCFVEEFRRYGPPEEYADSSDDDSDEFEVMEPDDTEEVAALTLEPLELDADDETVEARP